MKQGTLLLDGMPIPFEEGQTIMDAAHGVPFSTVVTK